MKRVLVTGSTGQVAQSLRALHEPDFEFVAVGRPRLDLTNAASAQQAIADISPFAVVNAAAYTAVDKAESEPDEAFAVNGAGAGAVATAAAAVGIPVIHLSTDYVFSGDKPTPYREEDAVGPTTVYGRSKLEGEHAVAAANPAHVILRTAWVHSPHGANFVKTMLRLAGEREVVRVVADQHGTPTYAPDIAQGILAVLRSIAPDPEAQEWRGVFHLVAGGETTWAGFAEAVFSASAARGGPSARVEPITTADYPTPARRPANSRLDTAKFRQTFAYVPPSWRDGVERCVNALAAG